MSKPLVRTRSELDRYLVDDFGFDNEELLHSPLEMWKSIEPKYPTVAKMAKDILSIPASGVGVERLFNTARDVCTYRRNRLNSTTIEIIMLIKWYEKLGIPSVEKSDILDQEGNQVDEPFVDEQAASVNEELEDVDWETESDESVLDGYY